VIDVLTPALAIAAAVPAVWSLVLVIRNKPMDTLTFWMIAVVEVGYLIATPLILPATVAWGIAERNRSGAAVVMVGCLAIPVLMLRIHSIWTGTG
jgi:hypothetical protein